MEKRKTTRTRKSTKYGFTLNNINTEKVDQKYGITLLSNLTNIDTNKDTTTLIELTETKKIKTRSRRSHPDMRIDKLYQEGEEYGSKGDMIEEQNLNNY
jgi:hypothetical protein